MAGIFRSFLHATNYRSPLLRTVVPTVATAFAIQGAVAIPSILAQTERFYDLSGSLTYLSCAALSLYLPVLRARAATGAGTFGLPWPSILKSLQGKSLAQGGFWDWRQLVLTAFVGIWATRCLWKHPKRQRTTANLYAVGTFLFSRITSENGQDSRFDKIRTAPSKFTVAFFAQATWVSLVMLPVTALNSMPPTAFAAIPYFTPGTLAGVALWLFGFAFEVTADRQKSQWMEEKKEKKHDEDFLTRGLWSKSRHPNYFGEITMWTGIAVTAGSILASNVGQKALGWSGSPAAKVGALAIAGVSPAFTTFLLTKVSGIPMSEGKYDKKYGDRKDYQKWKKETPVLIPKLF